MNQFPKSLKIKADQEIGQEKTGKKASREDTDDDSLNRIYEMPDGPICVCLLTFFLHITITKL